MNIEHLYLYLELNKLKKIKRKTKRDLFFVFFFSNFEPLPIVSIIEFIYDSVAEQLLKLLTLQL